MAGPLAGLRLTQVFGYAADQCDRVLEAVYRFPLPGDAAVTAVRVRFGDVEIRAELAERQQAEADYDRAREQGRQAALATRESPDVFTLQVAGIRPDQEVTVETSYVQLARPEGPGWSLRIPLTTAPRYVRSRRGRHTPRRGPAAGPAARPRPPLRPRPGPARGRRRREPHPPAGRGPRGGPPAGAAARRRGPARPRLRPDLAASRRTATAPRCTSWCTTTRPPGTSTSWRWWPPRRPATRGGACRARSSCWSTTPARWRGPKWQAADWAVERFLADLTGRDAFALGLFHIDDPLARPGPATGRRAGRRRGGRLPEGAPRQRGDRAGRGAGAGAGPGAGRRRAGPPRADRHRRRGQRRRVASCGWPRRSRGGPIGGGSACCASTRRRTPTWRQELAERGGGRGAVPDQRPGAGRHRHGAGRGAGRLVRAGAGRAAPGGRPAGRPRPPGTRSAAGDRTGWERHRPGRPARRAGRCGSSAACRAGSGGPLSFRLATGRGHELAGCRIEPAGEAPEGRALKALFGARRVLGLEHLIHAGYAGDELRDGAASPGLRPGPGPGGPARGGAEGLRRERAGGRRGGAARPAGARGAGLRPGQLGDRLRGRADRGGPGGRGPGRGGQRPAGRVVRGLPDAAGLRRRARRFGMLCASLALPAPPPSTTDASSAMPRRPRLLPSRGRSGVASPPAMGPRQRWAAPPCSEQEVSAPSPTVVFSGVPTLTGGEAILFDSARDRGVLPEAATLARLVVRFPEGSPDPRGLDPGLELRIFVDDPTTPRARVRLADLVRRRGERPLNLRVGPGQAVRIVLADPAGARAPRRPGSRSRWAGEDDGGAAGGRTTWAPRRRSRSDGPRPARRPSDGAGPGRRPTPSGRSPPGPDRSAERARGAAGPLPALPNRLRHRLGRGRQPAGQQLVEDQARAVDVTAAVDPAPRTREHLRAAAGRGGVADPAPPP